MGVWYNDRDEDDDDGADLKSLTPPFTSRPHL